MVQNSEWGPLLWRILHTCAEKLGRQTVPSLHADEQRAWIQLLRVTEGIMPCALCRKHYGGWKKRRPLEALQSGNRETFREAARRWLWDLHEDVNARREVVGGVAWEALEEMYGGRGGAELQQDVETLVKLLKGAAMLRQIEGAYLREWQGKLRLLRALIG